MASVNDVDTLFPEEDAPLNSRECPDWAKDRLEAVARTAWHPVSEPPTEADANMENKVLVIDAPGDDPRMCHYRACPTWRELHHAQWARVRDVVLMPEGDDGTS